MAILGDLNGSKTFPIRLRRGSIDWIPNTSLLSPGILDPFTHFLVKQDYGTNSVVHIDTIKRRKQS